jgi:hypothetical protein
MQGLSASYVGSRWIHGSVEVSPLSFKFTIVQMLFDEIGHPRRYWNLSSGLLDASRGLFRNADGDAADRHNISIT